MSTLLPGKYVTQNIVDHWNCQPIPSNIDHWSRELSRCQYQPVTGGVWGRCSGKVLVHVSNLGIWLLGIFFVWEGPTGHQPQTQPVADKFHSSYKSEFTNSKVSACQRQVLSNSISMKTLENFEGDVMEKSWYMSQLSVPSLLRVSFVWEGPTAH